MLSCFRSAVANRLAPATAWPIAAASFRSFSLRCLTAHLRCDFFCSSSLLIAALTASSASFCFLRASVFALIFCCSSNVLHAVHRTAFPPWKCRFGFSSPQSLHNLVVGFFGSVIYFRYLIVIVINWLSRFYRLFKYFELSIYYIVLNVYNSTGLVGHAD